MVETLQAFQKISDRANNRYIKSIIIIIKKTKTTATTKLKAIRISLRCLCSHTEKKESLMAIQKKKFDVLISVCKPHYHYPGCSRAAMMGRQSIQGIFSYCVSDLLPLGGEWQD